MYLCRLYRPFLSRHILARRRSAAAASPVTAAASPSLPPSTPSTSAPPPAAALAPSLRSQERTLTRAYNAACAQGRLKRALQAVHDLSLLPTGDDAKARLSRRAFFDAAAKRRAPWAALALLDELPHKALDVRTFNMAMRVCAAGADLTSASLVVRAMDQANVSPDYVIFTTWMTVAARAGDADTATRLLSEMKNVLGESSIGREAITSLLTACASGMDKAEGDRRRLLVLLERARSAFEAAVTRRVAPDAAMYNAYLTCLGRAGDLDGCMKFLAQMRARNLEPDVYTYTTLVSAFSNAGLGVRALALYRDALSSPTGSESPSSEDGEKGKEKGKGKDKAKDKDKEKDRRQIFLHSSFLHTAALHACRAADVVGSGDALREANSIIDWVRAYRVRLDDRAVSAALSLYGFLGDGVRLEEVLLQLRDVSADRVVVPLDAKGPPRSSDHEDDDNDDHDDDEEEEEDVEADVRLGVDLDDLDPKHDDHGRRNRSRTLRPRASATVLTAYVQALVKAGRLERALEMLSRMVAESQTDRRAQPGIRAVNAVLHGEAEAMVTDQKNLQLDISDGVGVPDEVFGEEEKREGRKTIRLRRVRRVSRVLSLMRDAGLEPTAHSFSAVLKAMQRLHEAELGIQVYRQMRRAGITLEASTCFTLLRLCHNKTRGAEDFYIVEYPEGVQMLENLELLPRSGAKAGTATKAKETKVPGGTTTTGGGNSTSSPTPSSSSSSSSVLEGRRARTLEDFRLESAADNSLQQDAGALESSNWTDRALFVYRDAISHGMQLDMTNLDMLLACLVVKVYPTATDEDLDQSWGDGPVSVMASGDHDEEFDIDGEAARRRQQYRKGMGVAMDAATLQRLPEGGFDPRVSTVVEQAINGGLLPPFPHSSSLGPESEVLVMDLRGLSPLVAQAYVLCAMTSLRRVLNAARYSKSGRFTTPVDILVDDFNPDAINLPASDLIIPEAEPEKKKTTTGSSSSKNASAKNSRKSRRRRFAVEESMIGDEEGVDMEAYVWGPTDRGSSTGLAVAAMMRRIRTHAKLQGVPGTISLSPEEVNRWVRASARNAHRVGTSGGEVAPAWATIRSGSAGVYGGRMSRGPGPGPGTVSGRPGANLGQQLSQIRQDSL